MQLYVSLAEDGGVGEVGWLISGVLGKEKK